MKPLVSLSLTRSPPLPPADGCFSPKSPDNNAMISSYPQCRADPHPAHAGPHRAPGPNLALTWRSAPFGSRARTPRPAVTEGCPGGSSAHPIANSAARPTCQTPVFLLNTRHRPAHPAPATTIASGRSSGVEHNLAKVGVVSSNLIARSIFSYLTVSWFRCGVTCRGWSNCWATDFQLS